jgi:hypothetical protein
MKVTKQRASYIGSFERHKTGLHGRPTLFSRGTRKPLSMTRAIANLSQGRWGVEARVFVKQNGDDIGTDHAAEEYGHIANSRHY